MSVPPMTLMNAYALGHDGRVPGRFGTAQPTPHFHSAVKWRIQHARSTASPGTNYSFPVPRAASCDAAAVWWSGFENALTFDSGSKRLPMGAFDGKLRLTNEACGRISSAHSDARHSHGGCGRRFHRSRRRGCISLRVGPRVRALIRGRLVMERFAGNRHRRTRGTSGRTFLRAISK